MNILEFLTTGPNPKYQEIAGIDVSRPTNPEPQHRPAYIHLDSSAVVLDPCKHFAWLESLQ